ncbi:hypothetical protein L0Y65_02215 [Candidatus Micrarchaeota archaeon]|nr:hypothetical protein [Candidatus Micrarchaeota archaeon]
MVQKTAEVPVKAKNSGIIKFTKMLPELDRLSALVKISKNAGKEEWARKLARRKTEKVLDALEKSGFTHYDFLRDGYYDAADIAGRHGLDDLERKAGTRILALEAMEGPSHMVKYAEDRFSNLGISREEISQALEELARLRAGKTERPAGEARRITLTIVWKAQDKVSQIEKRLTGRLAELHASRKDRSHDILRSGIREDYQEVISEAEKYGLVSIAREAAIESVALLYIDFGIGEIEKARRNIEGFSGPYMSQYGITREELKAAVVRNISRLLYQNYPSRLVGFRGRHIEDHEVTGLIANMAELAGLDIPGDTSKMAMGTIRACVSEGRYSNALRALGFLSPAEAGEISAFLHYALELEREAGSDRRINGELVIPIPLKNTTWHV